MKKVVLLLNIGTPNKPKAFSVARFLSEFLSDKYIININRFIRFILVHFFIIPFRTLKSTKRYKKLWTKDGSPILHHHQKLCSNLQTILPEEYIVYGAMRYGTPSITDTLKQIDFKNSSELIIAPLYPQYALATSGSSIDKVTSTLKKLNINCPVKIVPQFYDEPSYIETFAKQIQSYQPDNFNFVLFSYHGLPMSQVDAAPDGKNSKTETDYISLCRQSTELLANALNLPKDKYGTSFQSRISKNWTKPFTDVVLKELIQKGKKRVLIVSPSFVADCLETTLELGVEYKERFLANGGEELVLVNSLNDKTEWAKALSKIILKQ